MSDLSDPSRSQQPPSGGPTSRESVSGGELFDERPLSDDRPLSPEQQEAFIRLLNGSHGLLLRYVTSLGLGRHDAEDVLQRAGITMWRRFATFELGSDFIAWATTVAFYEVKNFQRATGRSRLTFDDELMRVLAAERALDLKRMNPRRDALEACLQQLDDDSGRLVRSIYVEERSAAAVAQERGLALQTIYNQLGFLRRALARCIERRLAEGTV
jgi:RNA polymerase sigma-70 factor (ECF subfamily)